MGKITRPKMEILKFGTEDVIATSGIPFYPVYSTSVNDISTGTWYLIFNGEGAKGFSDWNEYASHFNYGSDTLTLAHFDNGDWYNDSDSLPGGTNIADQNLSSHTNLTYIWYGSGYDVGNVNFNTQGQPWSYYLTYNIPLPRSD